MVVPASRVFRRRFPKALYVLFVAAVLFYFVSPPSVKDQFSQYYPTSGGRSSRSVLQYGNDGLAGNYTMEGRIHPIEELMQKGRDKWERLLKRQSRTLEEAVNVYRTRYGRNPPKGFDAWWSWAMENDIKIVDDYDQIYKDTYLYWGISPEVFRKRVDAIMEDQASFVTHLDPDGPSWFDGKNANFRADALMNLLEPLAPHMPELVEFVTSTHDLGSLITGDDQKQFLEEKIAMGEWATEAELRPFEWGGRHSDRGVNGLASVCPEDSPAWQESVAAHAAGVDKTLPRPVYTPFDADHPKFIYDHRATYDFCYYTEPLRFHGALSFDQPKHPFLRPMFQQSKFARNGEFVITPLDYYNNASLRGGQDQFKTWEEKSIAKLHWRGKTTGDSYSKRKDFNWRNSHRVRLHTITHDKEGTREIYVKSRRSGTWEKQTWDAKVLNEAYTDVGLTDGPMQCNKEDGTCQEMLDQIDWSPRVEPKVAANYKYVVDVDGNGWSSRFHRLLLSGSVNLKSTIYPEFFTDWLIPWYHYVPLQPTYSELYMILSFFIGVPGSPSTGNDELAQEIAENGRKFALEHWRWEDMQSYMFRLLLEYIRLGKDDRDAWSYSG